MDECVQRVKETTAELFREQRELVDRLNGLHRLVEAESHPVRKVLRKVEWMEEKDRSVELLGKIVVSLQRVLQADAAINEDALASCSAPSHRKAFSRTSRDDTHKTKAVDLDKLKAELSAAFKTSLAEGSVRKATAHMARQGSMSWEGKWSLGGAPPSSLRVASAPPPSSRTWSSRTWSLPDVSQSISTTLRRTKMFTWTTILMQ
ncbi:hypothetical protein T484DRAFT_1957557 [Baffinella frigidus]|nr:hypothetical protein T484DRAFT_1957557 [Cryptophyta sp. CCMP2293]